MAISMILVFRRFDLDLQNQLKSVHVFLPKPSLSFKPQWFSPINQDPSEKFSRLYIDIVLIISMVQSP